jgi:Mn2+/Fe2+ NRAMP family transporter
MNGIAAPPLMVLILLISNNKNIMGKHTNSVESNLLGIIITVVMGAASIALLASTLW